MLLTPMMAAGRSNLLKGLLIMALWFVFAVPSRADVMYVVKSGDSAWSVAVHFGVSLENLYAANGWAVDSDPVLQIGQAVAIPSVAGKEPAPVDTGDVAQPRPETYTAQPGDTFYHIAHEFHIGAGDLLAYNSLTENDILHIGQVLKLPPVDGGVQVSTVTPDLTGLDGSSSTPLRYKAVEGDNDWSIARRFGVSTSELLALNHLDAGAVIHVGDELLIPVSPGTGHQSRSLGSVYLAKAGDTLESVAKAQGVGLSDLLAENGLESSAQLVPGQQLRIPGYRSVPGSAQETTPGQAPAAPEDLSGELVPIPSLSSGPGGDGQWHSEIFDFAQLPTPQPQPDLKQEAATGQWSVDGHFDDGKPYHKYTVRRGDTVGEVAHTFGVTQSDLMSRNGLDNRSMLRIGRDLRIPLDAPDAPAPHPSASHSSSGSGGLHVGAPSNHAGAGEGTASGRKVVEEAMSHRGTPYVWGGNSLSGGVDCSGFTKAVFAKFGVDLPRLAGDQADCGVAVDFGNLKPGDLVFFHTTMPGICHVGIYIGGGEFVHASSHSGGVVTSTIETGYYNQRFVCARRVL